MTVDWSYIAGLFDSQGNIHITRPVDEDPDKFQVFVRINHHQEALLNDVVDFCGYGAVFPRTLTKNVRVYHQYAVEDKTDVYNFINNVRPFVIEKLQTLDFVLKSFDFLGHNGNFVRKLNEEPLKYPKEPPMYGSY